LVTIAVVNAAKSLIFLSLSLFTYLTASIT